MAALLSRDSYLLRRASVAEDKNNPVHLRFRFTKAIFNFICGLIGIKWVSWGMEGTQLLK